MAEARGPALTTVNISAPDPGSLARFYQRLLDWDIEAEEPDWILLRAADGGVGLAVQREENHVRPRWPAAGPSDQQMMMHLDIRVDDLESAGAEAAALGAVLADHQPQEDVRVWLDPAGHPFCLWLAD
ncbi:VOC family protein [Streptomyces reniochalinae]|uniref:VOC family protein n=1 Tax=Streptomyces reniochalinae TaxID=2250578 RepID=A0A367EGH8_9ACTN|nr:VOC family protein [Streptomyces reniochalinae]RCG17073.1 VOC family protein [Streptomyces reniochalinae]